jgi:hypothetical protein
VTIRRTPGASSLGSFDGGDDVAVVETTLGMVDAKLCSYVCCASAFSLLCARDSVAAHQHDPDEQPIAHLNARNSRPLVTEQKSATVVLCCSVS